MSKSSLVPIEHTLAVISDVHGNLPALEAVWQELDRRGVKRVLVAGDHLLKDPGPDGLASIPPIPGRGPLEVWRRLQSTPQRTVELARSLADTALATLHESRLVPRGKTDEEKREDEAKREAFLETRKVIGALVLKAIEKLPTLLRVEMADGRSVLVVHGSPRDPGVDITHDLEDDDVTNLLGGEPADIVVVAGAHAPFQREVRGVRVVGLGSVGQPLGGELTAHVVLITPRYEGALIEEAWVPYGA